MTTLTGWLTIVNLVVLLAGSLGGFLVVRSAISKAEMDIQTRIREALSTENALLQSRVQRVEKENKRLDKLLLLVATTLKKTQHIELEVDEDVIILRSASGTHTSRIPTDEL